MVSGKENLARANNVSLTIFCGNVPRIMSLSEAFAAHTDTLWGGHNMLHLLYFKPHPSKSRICTWPPPSDHIIKCQGGNRNAPLEMFSPSKNKSHLLFVWRNHLCNWRREKAHWLCAGLRCSFVWDPHPSPQALAWVIQTTSLQSPNHHKGAKILKCSLMKTSLFCLVQSEAGSDMDKKQLSPR